MLQPCKGHDEAQVAAALNSIEIEGTKSADMEIMGKGGVVAAIVVVVSMVVVVLLCCCVVAVVWGEWGGGARMRISYGMGDKLHPRTP